MSGKKLIVVFGATGRQGGSVARALQASGEYDVRGVTRNVEKAKEKIPNIQWVKADQTKPEELKKAFEGAYGVFAVTNFWDPESMGKEVEIGTNLAKSAKEANVQYYIWSTLPNAEEISGGKFHVPHFTDKEKVNHVVKSLGFPFYAFFQPGAYWQNYGMYSKNEDGSYTFRMPCKATTRFAGCDIDDTGGVVLQMFKHPETYKGKFIPLCGEDLTVEEMREIFEKHTGKKTTLDLSQHAGYPGAHEMNEMFGFMDAYGCFPNEDLSAARKVYPALKTFKQFLETTDF